MTATSRIETILHRDRQTVAAILIFIITVCWVYVLTGAGSGMYPHEMAVLIPGRTTPTDMLMTPATWDLPYALLMFSMWWLMMIAMMLPSAAPMVLFHATAVRSAPAMVGDARASRSASRLLPSTLAFIAGYLVLWGVVSLVAVLVQWWLARRQLLSGGLTSTSAYFSAGLLLAAGLWQLTPAKKACLRRCRSPVSFVSAYWRPGVGGAFSMGIRHGVFCTGCCWLLMALLFYGGVMNLFWIIGLAMFVFTEKTVRPGIALGQAGGLLLIAWGLWLGLAEYLSG